MDSSLVSTRFPRSSAYHPEWIVASASGGANPLWLAEWLTTRLELKPGMRVLDIGCGRAASSIFLHREFGVQVWATDLWFNASENLQRIRDAGVDHAVFPIHADARALPFANDFFDAVVSIDSIMYYGTDDLFLSQFARFLRPGGVIGIAASGLTAEITGDLPEHLRAWWEPNLWSLHSADWWKRHWQRTGIVDVEVADHHPDGCQLWLDWHRAICPGNTKEIEALEADAGRLLGYIRVIARRRPDVLLEEPIVSVPAQYEPKPLLRTRVGGSGAPG